MADKEIYLFIKFRDKLHFRLRNTENTSPLYETFKTNLSNFNKILKRNIRKAKAMYYNGQFQKFKKDIKITWKTIKDIIKQNNDKKKVSKRI